ncbi:hypothetical protein AB2M62_14805 [Sphingomonas sp. MMS12-HWE2-04]|uniref:hypothetical protein n=1 Tax=Sphingomonas sp. MMS12-HWE2-04 TaxID=3234199 RepID=UPI00384D5D73
MLHRDTGQPVAVALGDRIGNGNTLLLRAKAAQGLILRHAIFPGVFAGILRQRHLARLHALGSCWRDRDYREQQQGSDKSA